MAEKRSAQSMMIYYNARTIYYETIKDNRRLAADDTCSTKSLNQVGIDGIMTPKINTTRFWNGHGN
jgi:hypothetical protein